MTRVALVTGAAGGIGGATLRRLAASGYAVTGVDLRPLEDAASGPGEVVGEVADVRDRAALDRVLARTVERWGRIDAVVAAAAVIHGGRPLWETPPEELDALLDTDLRGVWHTAAATVPAMLAGPDPSGCRFVAIASAAGTYGLHHLAAYNVAKHGVVGLVKGLAADLVGTGVTACAVSPGSTRTPMLNATAALYGLPDPEVFARHQLLHRLLEPEEIAAVVAFCCSLEAAAVNGTVVHADGGFAP